MNKLEQQDRSGTSSLMHLPRSLSFIIHLQNFSTHPGVNDFSQTADRASEERKNNFYFTSGIHQPQVVNENITDRPSPLTSVWSSLNIPGLPQSDP